MTTVKNISSITGEEFQQLSKDKKNVYIGNKNRFATSPINGTNQTLPETTSVFYFDSLHPIVDITVNIHNSLTDMITETIPRDGTPKECADKYEKLLQKKIKSGQITPEHLKSLEGKTLLCPSVYPEYSPAKILLRYI